MGDVVVKVFPIKPNKYNQVAYFTIIIEDKIKLTVFCKRKMHIIAVEELTTPDLHFCC